MCFISAQLLTKRIVLHEVLLFWFLTGARAPDSSPMDVLNEGSIHCSCNSTWSMSIEGHHYQHSYEVTGVNHTGVCGRGIMSVQGRWD
jgi:hypothetical protein